MSRRALSLAAYLAYARGVSGRATTPVPTRPDGPVVWVYAETPEQGRALASLCVRLSGLRPEAHLFMSGSTPNFAPDPPDIQICPLPADTLADSDAFAQGLRPDVVLWAGHSLRPALLEALKRVGSYLIAVDMRDQPWSTPAPRWMPDPAPATLALFNCFFTLDGAANRRLRRLGVHRDRVRKKGPLIDTDPPPSCDDHQHEDLASLLTGRPIWLAANLQVDEANDVLRAHRITSRLAHRLLLIVVPTNENDAARILAEAEAQQLRVCQWDIGETPGEHTQVLITEGPEELGLWYRLAPLVFLGGSLSRSQSGQSPYLAAAMGAAILYGPNVGQHLEAYSRLVDAGAARIVRDADSLAAAVAQLVAPDQAAVMAHAGWDLVSSGATLVDAVLTEICQHLDHTGVV